MNLKLYISKINQVPSLKWNLLFLSALILVSICLPLFVNDLPIIIRWEAKDVFSGILTGLKWSLLIGTGSMVLASVIGITLGLVSGFFGNNEIYTSAWAIAWYSLGILLCWFYGFYVFRFEPSGSTFVITIFVLTLISTIFYFGWQLIRKMFNVRHRIYFPLDSLISRTIELLNSIPKIVLVVVLTALIKNQSVWNLILIIGLTSWTGIARILRAEILKAREQPYIEAAKALGMGPFHIILKHLLPNTITPALVVIAFGTASAILIESGLSFLGIGVPVEVITLGKIISTGKNDFDAWWLMVFPGIALFILVFTFNKIAEGIRELLDGK